MTRNQFAQQSKPIEVSRGVPFAALLVACLLGSCGGERGDNGLVVANAGGRNISASLFSAYTQQLSQGKPENLDPALRARLLQQLVQLTKAADAEEDLAEQNTIDELELHRINMLARKAAVRAGVFAEPNDSEIQRAYADFLNSQSAVEYRVAHILLPTEARALGIIRQLKNGADFATLARSESADDSRSKGGEIGWVHSGTFPNAFMSAVTTLSPGQNTATPVKTPYGWHVIHVFESRRRVLPPLTSVRAQLLSNLQQRKYEEFLRSAR